MNDASLTVLDLSRFRRLKKLVIGDECFMYVNEVKMVGLKALESVEIRKNSFTKNRNYYGNNSNRRFYVRNCPKLKSLKIGRYSFSDYTVIGIESVDSLEVIEMGDVKNKEWSFNFYYASLDLKSILIHRE